MDDELGWCNACKNYVEDCICHLKTGPAPKEERMHKSFPETNHRIPMPPVKPCKSELIAERRALYREAYMAALGGLMSLAAEVDCGISGLVNDAGIAAIETVRQWYSMMEELEKEIGG